jgi:L-iditol 2-dehydrogenase
MSADAVSGAAGSLGVAARLHGARDLRLHDEPPPEPGPGDVLVRIGAVGLCGSDRHWFLDGAVGDTALTAPLVLGHEFAGAIVGGSRDGERVVVDPASPCERCDLCRGGNGRLCRSMRFAGQAPTDGALQTWFAWPGSRCIRLPDSIPDDEAILLEVLGIALHAIDLAVVEPGMVAGVYGCGPVGLVLVRALRAAGVGRIVASDRLANRVEAAAASGATQTQLVGDGPDPAAAIPVDVAFECAGEDAALESAVRAVAPGGRVLIVGIPESDRSTFPASPARRKEVILQLVRRMEAPDLPRAIELVSRGDVRLDGLVSHRFALAQVADAFEVLAARSGIKIVVAPG